MMNAIGELGIPRLRAKLGSVWRDKWVNKRHTDMRNPTVLQGYINPQGHFSTTRP